MPAILYTRPGDAQALKVVIAAKLAGSTVDVQQAASVAAVQAKASNPFSTNAIALVVKDAEWEATITESNAYLRVTGSQLPLAAAPAAEGQLSSWLNWEATVLRPAVLLGQADAALRHLESALASSGHVIGSTVSAADIAVYCTLLPLQLQGRLAGNVAGFMTKLSALAAVSSATEAALFGQPPAAFVALFEADAATFRHRQPKVPIPGRRNILITSALPYVNNVPHLGNIIGCVLSADCYARFCRARGHNCIYVCGTDEYGTATETKALEEGLTCAQICDKYHAIHADIYRWFDIAFDKFGRTPTRAQTAICQSIFRDVHAAGNCVEQGMEQLFSEALGKFLADRFVTGTCPKCRYEDARGDQCDGCGNLLNPTELVNPKCKVTGTTPVVRSTQHLFLDLPKLTDPLQQYITSASQQGGWSSNCQQVTNAWMRDGLKYRCITRDLKWGTPVPLPGYEDKVFYVWFDAPIGYISITANYCEQWQAWWQNPEEVEMVQFMGKDNVPFHTVIFPATLLGTGKPWTMMRNISVTEYLNYEGGKFSKSRGTGVFGNDAKDTGMPVEVWRYYLLSNRPEQSDTDFKWTDLAAKNNSELLANLGNFINRALMFVGKFYGGAVPAATAKGQEAVAELGRAAAAKVGEYVAAMEKIKLREGIKIVMALSADGNKFIQDTKPWVSMKEDPDHAATVVAAAVGLVRLLAALLHPYMPSLAAKILAQLNLPDSALQLSDELIAAAAQPDTIMPAGHPINKPEPLIREIPEAQIAELRARYGGSQAERNETAAASASGAPSSATAGSKKPAAGGKPAPAGGNAGAKGADTGAKGDAKAKGEGKAKGEAKADGKAKPAADGKAKSDSDAPDVSRLDIRVGFIRKAWRHPDAESLYVEEIDIGEATPRTVVSGLVKHVAEADMQQRPVVVLCNLKPANMRGVQSQAMVLAATSADGATVQLVDPPAGAKVGERVQVAGYDGVPDEVLNPKKRVFEQVQPDFSTNAECVACYRGVPFLTSAGPCTAHSIAGGTIR